MMLTKLWWVSMAARGMDYFGRGSSPGLPKTTFRYHPAIWLSIFLLIICGWSYLRAYVEVPLLGFTCSNHSFWSLTEHEQTCGKGWGNCKTESAESSEGCKWPMSYMWSTLSSMVYNLPEVGHNFCYVEGKVNLVVSKLFLPWFTAYVNKHSIVLWVVAYLQAMDMIAKGGFSKDEVKRFEKEVIFWGTKLSL